MAGNSVPYKTRDRLKPVAYIRTAPLKRTLRRRAHRLKSVATKSLVVARAMQHLHRMREQVSNGLQ